MILVTDVKIMGVKRDDFYPIASYNPKYSLAMDGADIPNDIIEVKQEWVKGKRFCDSKGRIVVIGWDKATQNALGLPFEAFENQEKRRESDYRENTQLRKKTRELENMTLLQFIKKKTITIGR